MIWQPIVAAALAAMPVLGSPDIQEVRVVASGADTEIVVFTDASVEAREFLLAEPSRLIVDLYGAEQGSLRGNYDAIGRGGVLRMRSSQFRPDVVRLVFELTGLPSYETEASEGRFVIRFANPGAGFASWSSSQGETLAMEDRGPAPTADAPPETPRSDLMNVLQEEPARITVAYDSASMLDVLAGFSEFAGVSIVPSTDAADVTVRGVDIRNQRWDVALDAILASQGLGWRMQSEGILIVDKLEGIRARDTLQTQTRVFRINYASADSVASTLAALATPGRGRVVAYKGANSVLITAVPSVVARMDTLV
ncbi:MAG: AMIN domain-containing protein, partial [Gemmatimonadota bacterium]